MVELNRRNFAKSAIAISTMKSLHSYNPEDYQGGLTDLQGVKVGHFTDTRRPTGCTVILVEEGAVAGVDVRGSAPGTRETDLLNPINTVEQVHAIVLSGGSAFGLETATGVVRYLEERDIGYPTSVARVPIVPAAVPFDPGLGDASIRPDSASGHRACEKARNERIPEGNVGAGTGATVGKFFGMKRAMKGGLGSFSIKAGDLTVAALAAVNCIGDVIDPSNGQILAGARSADGSELANTMKTVVERVARSRTDPGENTTLATVATNAAFDKSGMTKIAQMSHDGLARSINPVHLPHDGDTIFALSTAGLKGIDLGLVGAIAAEAVKGAVIRAILTAKALPGFPSYGSFRSGA
jgi:L-aminopeptidase/D-esterase-like protein